MLKSVKFKTKNSTYVLSEVENVYSDKPILKNAWRMRRYFPLKCDRENYPVMYLDIHKFFNFLRKSDKVLVLTKEGDANFKTRLISNVYIFENTLCVCGVDDSIEGTTSITTSEILEEINPEVLEELSIKYPDMIKPCQFTKDMELLLRIGGWDMLNECS